MGIVFSVLDAGSRSLSYLLGFGVLALAAGVIMSSLGVAEIGTWALKVFGATFLVLLGAMVIATLFCWTRQRMLAGEADQRRVWLEAGQHAASGVATLALTYTLFGISLGIGGLAGQELTPETVQVVIRELTGHFSLAFMTTVVGLPLSAALRALISITESRLAVRSNIQHRPAWEGPS